MVEVCVFVCRLNFLAGRSQSAFGYSVILILNLYSVWGVNRYAAHIADTRVTQPLWRQSTGQIIDRKSEGVEDQVDFPCSRPGTFVCYYSEFESW